MSFTAADISDDEQFLAIVNTALERCDFSTLHERSDNYKELPIIYIVGAPRSGTTLVHQVLAKALPFGYIDNVVARFWRKPSVGMRLSRILMGDERHKLITFESRLGVSPGPGGPHEFGYFWNRWMEFTELGSHHLRPDELARIDRIGLRESIESEILAYCKEGLLLKNLTCGFQASFLTSLHQKTIWIHVVRNPVTTVASILRFRMQHELSDRRWFSLRPSSFPLSHLENDIVAQSWQQVIDSRREISDEILKSGAPSILVNYEEFCLNPSSLIEMVLEKLLELGNHVDRRPIVFPAFKVENNICLPSELGEQLSDLERRYFSA